MTAISSAQDRRLLAEAVRECARSRGGPRPYLATDDSPSSIDLELWGQLGSQIGLSGLLVPDHLGGAGASIADAVAALVELGAALAPVPALATVGMATPLLRACPPSTAVDELLRQVATDALVMAVGWPDAGSADVEGIALRLDAEGRASGRASFVLDGTIADAVVLAARDRSGPCLINVDTRAEGVSRLPMTTLDLSRGMAEVLLDSAPVTVLCDGDVATAALDTGVDIALVFLAAEEVGIAGRCLDEAVAYAKQRVQFDRPIGSFQAVKHRLVDLLLQVEQARSALDLAVAAADDYLADPSSRRATALRAAASMGKAMGSDAATVVAAETLHVFGGIGFTWEHDAHLYFRRAKTLATLLGGADAHRRRMASALGVVAP